MCSCVNSWATAWELHEYLRLDSKTIFLPKIMITFMSRIVPLYNLGNGGFDDFPLDVFLAVKQITVILPLPNVWKLKRK